MRTSRRLLRIVTDDDVVELEAHDTTVIPVMSSDEFAAYHGTAPQLPAPDFAAPVAAMAEPGPGRSRLGRAFVLAMLVATVLCATLGAVEVHHAVSDGWIAPRHRSPDSEAVAQLRLDQQRYRAELARLDAAVAQLDSQLAAIRVSIGKLSRAPGD